MFLYGSALSMTKVAGFFIRDIRKYPVSHSNNSDKLSQPTGVFYSQLFMKGHYFLHFKREVPNRHLSRQGLQCLGLLRKPAL